MAFPSEVGLRLLLSPLGSNIVMRTACCSVGVILPVYSTFKAIENKDQNQQQKWLIYWAAYGSFSIAEAFADKIISWFPMYYHMKFAFLVWLQLPSINADEVVNVAQGARQLYFSHLRPFLLRHQARLDQVVDLAYTEMAKFVSSHDEEIQFARAIVSKVAASARDVIYPRQAQMRRPHPTDSHRRRQIQHEQPDDDDHSDYEE